MGSTLAILPSLAEQVQFRKEIFDFLEQGIVIPCSEGAELKFFATAGRVTFLSVG